MLYKKIIPSTVFLVAETLCFRGEEFLCCKSVSAQ
jgi:hypothetical protein